MTLSVLSSPWITTWLHFYIPETIERPKQVDKGKSASKQATTIPSVGKVRATVFWYWQGVIFIDYLKKNKTITGEYYSLLLGSLKIELKKNVHDWSTKKSFPIKTMHSGECGTYRSTSSILQTSLRKKNSQFSCLHELFKRPWYLQVKLPHFGW